MAFDADELWWPGTVHKLRKGAGGCVNITYDDGDFEKRKPLARVRPLLYIVGRRRSVVFEFKFRLWSLEVESGLLAPRGIKTRLITYGQSKKMVRSSTLYHKDT